MNDRTSFIGYIANSYLEAHGLSISTLKTCGVQLFTAHRPEQSVAFVERGEANALLQEAIMTPWWEGLIDSNKITPLPAESDALQKLEASLGLRKNPLPKGFWTSLSHELPALDFSEFVILVRDDMPTRLRTH